MDLAEHRNVAEEAEELAVLKDEEEQKARSERLRKLKHWANELAYRIELWDAETEALEEEVSKSRKGRRRGRGGVVPCTVHPGGGCTCP